MTRKIINDPVYGFITLNNPLVLAIVEHPWYQRLRRIHQMALAPLVYPGAVHTRLHHSLGAYHLMCNALAELKGKGVEISAEEETAAQAAILLHDAGHGPYSHALEQVLVKDLHHESLSLLIMEDMNRQFNGALTMAIDIFTGRYHKQFLHQLVSGQLDVDRMDYLSRDSFFTGVSEGVIGYDRIIKMLTVHNGQLVVEEKGIYSIEKFLVARRLMYWQAYLHKTVLAAEKMLVKIMERAKEIKAVSSTPFLDMFLSGTIKAGDMYQMLDEFCYLDDYDVMASVKWWMHHEDKVLSLLCRQLTNRKLFKIRFTNGPQKEEVERTRAAACAQLGIDPALGHYLVFDGEAVNSTYTTADEQINILFKDGTVKDISQVDHALLHQGIAAPVKKYYICNIRM
jgi:uncharacterized protein